MFGRPILRPLTSSCLWLGALALIATSSCTDDPVASSLRALESSGNVAFVCLDAPNDDPNAQARVLSDCNADRAATAIDYGIPHLYALVTQPTRGELAVIDLTTNQDAVLDQDPIVPGANFLHIGARPGAIVATPGGVASFVTNIEPNFEGIFAIPSTSIRGDQAGAERTALSSWPVCSLPSAPGDMLLLVDPPNDVGEIRKSCNDDYSASSPNQGARGDLLADATRSGQAGVYKLAVTLPKEGGVAIIDAQKLLDQDGGAFEGCPIERWLPLTVSLPPIDTPEPEDDRGGSCAENLDPVAPDVQSASAAPTDLTSAGGTLYVADRTAPVIHRVVVNDPCAPSPIDPLLPRSTDSPQRVVTTSQLVVSPLTLSLKRYLYALDTLDGSIIAFDVSEDSTVRTPLARPLAGDPFGASDRIRFQSPVRQIAIVEHQNDQSDDTTGGTIPVLCDPDPDSDGPGTVYRTAADYSSGAGPTTLRGVFAFAILTSGDVVIIDIEDYDAPCRGPASQSIADGCTIDGENLETTGEPSCLVVTPHRPRSQGYIIHAEDIAKNQAGVTTLPSLVDAEGALLKREADAPFEFPSMRATLLENDPANFELTVGSEQLTIDGTGGLLTDGSTTNPVENVLSFNTREPRTHLLDQNWTVSYEGRLPGFSGRFAQLTSTADGFELRDTSANFCGRGVISQTALVERATHAGTNASVALADADLFADYVQITSGSPAESDPYWPKQNACTFKSCKDTYGANDAPLTSRDLRIVEASDGSLTLESRATASVDSPTLACCFPGVVEYAVRTGSQWTVLGSAVGFLHDVRAADRGVCRPACDDSKKLLDGRAREVAPSDDIVEPFVYGSGESFANPMFSFGIVSTNSARDMQFRFTTQNSFQPLTMTLVTTNSDVQPQDVVHLPSTGELAVSDGSRNGLTLLDLDLLQISRQYN